jgi:hypothetical protein
MDIAHAMESSQARRMPDKRAATTPLTLCHAVDVDLDFRNTGVVLRAFQQLLNLGAELSDFS